MKIVLSLVNDDGHEVDSQVRDDDATAKDFCELVDFITNEYYDGDEEAGNPSPWPEDRPYPGPEDEEVKP